jgi:hypothetical protein
MPTKFERQGPAVQRHYPNGVCTYKLNVMRRKFFLAAKEIGCACY